MKHTILTSSKCVEDYVVHSGGIYAAVQVDPAVQDSSGLDVRHCAQRGVYVRGPTAAFDELRVERDDIHSVPHPHNLFGQPPRDAALGKGQLWIEEELYGVVAGLTMDVYCARKVGSDVTGALGPIVVGEQGRRGRDGDKVTGAVVINVLRGLPGAV